MSVQLYSSISSFKYLWHLKWNQYSTTQIYYLPFFISFTTTTYNFHIIFSSLDSSMDIYPFLSAGASWKFPSNEHFFTFSSRQGTYLLDFKLSHNLLSSSSLLHLDSTTMCKCFHPFKAFKFPQIAALLLLNMALKHEFILNKHLQGSFSMIRLLGFTSKIKIQ